MTRTWDVIVAGMGAMGSATVAELAGRGQRVLGLDRFDPPHEMGSSHGKSRIIREAYFEDPRYVPLVRRAYQRWQQLEERTGETFFRRTGGLMLGPPDGIMVSGSRRSAEEHGLTHDLLDAAEIRRRFPAFHVPDGMQGVLEPNAGMLAPERAIAACLSLARQHGADLRSDEPMLEWRPDGEGVAVRTPAGVHRARRLVIAAGAWTADLLAELRLPLQVQRNVIYWFGAAGNAQHLDADHCPVFVWEHAVDDIWYGLPDSGDGFKVGRHHHGPSVHPDTVSRTVGPEETGAMRAILRRFIPDADGPLLSAVACLYTNTPDGHFIIDHHPEHAQVIVATPCSGHGFKFASAIGEIFADLATDQVPQSDISLFRINRFAGA